MQALRRVRLPHLRSAAEPRPRPTTLDEETPPRLRGAGGRLAAAVRQLRAGIPLNWTQIEGDPELQALAHLFEAAQPARSAGLGDLPPGLRAEVVERLARKLPKAKPAAPVSQPRPLAGFSEAVPVLTQTEDDVPSLTSSMTVWVAATVVAGAVVMLALWLLGAALQALRPATTFEWISVARNGTPVVKRTQPAGAVPQTCGSSTSAGGAPARTFVRVQNLAEAQQYSDFPIILLPTSLSAVHTYTLRLQEVVVAPCEGGGPVPRDLGAIVSLQYQLTYRETDGTAFNVSHISVFQGKQMPVVVDASTGSWKVVEQGAARGILWQGTGYVDLAGRQHLGVASVLVIEKDDLVTTFVGRADRGTTEGLLVQLLRAAEEERAAAKMLSTPFAWIELRRSGEVISTNQRRESDSVPRCSTPVAPGGSSSEELQYLNTFEEAQANVGYPIVTLPPTVTLPVTITTNRTIATPSFDGRTPPVVEQVVTTEPVAYNLRLLAAAVRPCSGGPLQRSDPGAKVKLTYRVSTESPSGLSLMPTMRQEVVIFEQHRRPAPFDVAQGEWEDVAVGEARGIAWRGFGYSDPEGGTWLPTINETWVNVVIFEKGDTVVTLVGFVTRELLLGLAREMR